MRHIKEIDRLKRNVPHGTRSSIGGNKYVKDEVYTQAPRVYLVNVVLLRKVHTNGTGF